MPKQIKIQANVPTGPARLASPGIVKFGRNLANYGNVWKERLSAPIHDMAKVGAALRGKNNNLTLGEMQGAIFDSLLLGMPGGGTGPANIGKKDLLKSFAKSFRGLDKMEKARASGIEQAAKAMGIKVPKTKGRSIANFTARENYRELIRAVRATPQKELDRLKSAGLMNFPASNKHGHYLPDQGHIDINIGKSRAQGETANTWFHETAHSRNITKSGSGLDKPVNKDVLERMQNEKVTARSRDLPYRQKPEEYLANLTGGMLSQAVMLRKGKIPDKVYDKVYNNALRASISKADSRLYKDVSKLLQTEIDKTIDTGGTASSAIMSLVGSNSAKSNKLLRRSNVQQRKLENYIVDFILGDKI